MTLREQILEGESHRRHSVFVEGRRKPGPAPKGVRSQITLRVPAEHREIYALAAAANGLALNDYLVAVLARAHHLPVPAEVRGAGAQEGVPLNSAR